MSYPWDLVMDLGYIAVLLIVAWLIRKALPFLKTFRVPDAIIAGIIGVILGPSILKILPFQTDRMAAIVYHFSTIAFTALALRREEQKGRTRTAISTGFYNGVSYAIQGGLGLLITLILIKTIYPNLFPAFGLFLPFSFAQGPQMAGSMGTEWGNIVLPSGKKALEFGTSVGFSFSTIGLFWACFVGVPLMNWLIRRRLKKEGKKPREVLKATPESVKVEEKGTTSDFSVDKMTIQVAIILVIYVILFFCLKGLTWVLSTYTPKDLASTIVPIFWSIQFVFGALIGTAVGKIIHTLEDRKILKERISDDHLLQHLGGLAIDFMIAASIAAIDIRVFQAYIVPILLITTLGGLATIGYTWFLVKLVWPKTFVEHFVAFFGDQTGTLASGMALLRGVDPEFKTSATSDLVYGSAMALPIAAPLIFVAAIPIYGLKTGQPQYYWWTLLILLGYLALVLGLWLNPWSFKYLTKHSRVDKVEKK
ncbi:hypothetical protein GX441_08175 [bacterium]|nr:hypothetical protein [bacterium]